jgi:hypothetical protein
LGLPFGILILPKYRDSNPDEIAFYKFVGKINEISENKSFFTYSFPKITIKYADLFKVLEKCNEYAKNWVVLATFDKIGTYILKKCVINQDSESRDYYNFQFQD